MLSLHPIPIYPERLRKALNKITDCLILDEVTSLHYGWEAV